MSVVVWMLWGCTGPEPVEPPPAPPRFEEEPVLARPSDDVGGVRVLTVRTDLPTTVTARIDDPTGAREVHSDVESTEHELVLVGFRVEGTTTVTVDAAGATGSATVDLQVEGDGLPDAMPDVDFLIRDDERLPRGWWLLPTTSPQDALRIGGTDLLLDADLEVVWWRVTDRPLGDLRMSPWGTLVGQGLGGIQEIDWTGRVLRRFTPDPEEPEDILLEAGSVHHDAVPLEDGTFMTLAHSVRDVDPFPQSYDPPDPVAGPSPVQSTLVTHFDEQGRTLEAVELLDVIDPTRISYGSLSWSIQLQAYDHSHANAVVVDDDGGWIVSMRHQDAIIKVDPDGTLRWILGDPAGWQPPWSDLLLEQVDPFVWPYHQHAPTLRPDGSILMFDNTNADGTPYTPPPGVDRPSRLLEVRVDEDAGTVEHLWSFVPVLDGPLHSEAMGDADWLPGDLVLGVWGFLLAENDTPNADRGLGDYVTRWMVVDPDAADDPVVLDVRLSSQRAERAFGWGMYRAEFLEAL